MKNRHEAKGGDLLGISSHRGGETAAGLGKGLGIHFNY